MDAEIHDRGRGPEIKGTRITVYDVLDYRGEFTTDWIANLFDVTVEQIEAAEAYIDSHRDVVMRDYAKMIARDDQGNPPENRAMMAATRQKIQAAEKALKHVEVVHA